VTTLDSAQLAVALARAADLLHRSPEPGTQQKTAVRALVALAAERSATFRFYGGTLTVDGAEIPMADPRLAAFAKRLADQQVAEIAIARGAGPDELLALALGLAAEAGRGRLKERLRDAGSTRVMVVLDQAPTEAQRSRGVTAAFDKVKLDQAVIADWNKFLEKGAKTESDRHGDWGPAEQDAGEASGIVGHAPDAPAPAAPPAEASPTGAAPVTPSAAPPAEASPAGAAPAAPSAEPPPQRLTQSPTLQGASPLGVALLAFLKDPYGEDTLTRLTKLSRHVQDAFSQDRVVEGIDAVATLADLEAAAPDPRVKNMYTVIFARVLTRSALERAAPYLLEPRRRDRVAAVLRRGGEFATELLVKLISAAQTLGERIQYVAVLRDLPRGTDRLLALMSTRSEWQLVRNVAELAGEARIEAAVPYLAGLLEHEDDRLSRTALVAMAKIGTAATTEALRNVLRSGTPEQRSLVASNIGGAQAKALVVTLAAVAHGEGNPDVIRECLRALGRIGTPDAIAALERVAAGRSAIFSRGNKAGRAAAEEVLRSLGRGSP
jgi:hypothetical protein